MMPTSIEREAMTLLLGGIIIIIFFFLGHTAWLVGS